jgi:hypothetical protein
MNTKTATFSFALNLNHLDPLNSTFPEENCNMIEIKLRNYPQCTMYGSLKNEKWQFYLSFLSATMYNAMKWIRSIPSNLVQCHEAHKMEHTEGNFADTLSKRIFAVLLPVANLQAHNSSNSGSPVLQKCNQQTWKAARCHTTHRRGIPQQRNNNIQSSFQMLLVKSNAQVINGFVLQLCATTLLEKRFTL